MKNLLTIQDSTINRISFYHLAAFVLLLPFDRFYSELVLGSLLIHTLIHARRSSFSKAWTVEVLLVSSVFILGVIGSLYTEDGKQASKDLQRQLALVLIPLCFTISDFPFSKYRDKILFIFSIGCVATVLILYIRTFSEIIDSGASLTSIFSRRYLNHNFSAPVGIHATYLSLYISVSIIFLTLLLLNEPKRSNRFLLLAALLLLLAGMTQLASRAACIGLIAMSLCLPFMLTQKEQRRSFIIATVLVSFLAIAAVFAIDSFKKRYIDDFKDDLIQASINNDRIEPRITRWQCAIELIKEKPLTGHGSGSEKRLLRQSYFSGKLYNSFLNELNAHNQYLSLGLKHGIVGVLIFIATLLTSLYMAGRKRDIVFAAFLIGIAVVSFSENILDVNKGIFFYAFFFSLFLVSGKPFASLLRLKK